MRNNGKRGFGFEKHVFSILSAGGTDVRFGIDLFDTDFRLFYDYPRPHLFFADLLHFFAAPWALLFFLCSFDHDLGSFDIAQIVFVPAAFFSGILNVLESTSRRRTFFRIFEIEERRHVGHHFRMSCLFALFSEKHPLKLFNNRVLVFDRFVQLFDPNSQILYGFDHLFELFFIHFDRRLFFLFHNSIIPQKRREINKFPFI